jgi:hypothetical protein
MVNVFKISILTVIGLLGAANSRIDSCPDLQSAFTITEYTNVLKTSLAEIRENGRIRFFSEIKELGKFGSAAQESIPTIVALGCEYWARGEIEYANHAGRTLLQIGEPLGSHVDLAAYNNFVPPQGFSRPHEFQFARAMLSPAAVEQNAKTPVAENLKFIQRDHYSLDNQFSIAAEIIRDHGSSANKDLLQFLKFLPDRIAISGNDAGANPYVVAREVLLAPDEGRALGDNPELLTKKIRTLRLLTIRMLGFTGPKSNEATEIVSALDRLITEGRELDSYRDIEIFQSLARFGAPAESALPKLRKIAESQYPDYERSEWAKVAIQKIEAAMK